MPRRNPERDNPAGRNRTGKQATISDMAARILGPQEVRREGWVVKRSVREDREYRCPYCHGRIVPGTPHVVAYRNGRLEDRRHYHTGCWSKESLTGNRPDPR